MCCQCLYYINDTVNEVAELFREADGLVLASPVYYASANATLIAQLDRTKRGPTSGSDLFCTVV